MSDRTLLTPDRYDVIDHAMTAVKLYRPSAAVAIDAEFLETESELFGVSTRCDYSLTRQLGQLIANPASVNPEATTPPDAVLVTENSAIPTADAIRGFYDAAGLTRPLIGTIRSNRTLSRNAWFGTHAALGPDGTAESWRLARVLRGKEHVVVIDQLVASGRTLRYAGKILAAAGVDTVSGIRGFWYDQAPEKDIRFNDVSSVHADAFHAIGEKAFQGAQALAEIETEHYTNMPYTTTATT